ncbi:hypothetical protein RJ55_00017 [Drechmeria coniospora]|nr:hypothetical protein RJ55_00017 [Drechmeria coniospora]
MASAGRQAQRLTAQLRPRLQTPARELPKGHWPARRAASNSACGGRTSRCSPWLLWGTAVALGVVAPVAFQLTNAGGTKLDVASLADKDAQKKREAPVTGDSPMRLRMEKFIKEQQQIIVKELERVDGKRFRTDEWARKDGGGGITCVLQDGNVFEKAGVGVSVVYGSLPKPAIQKMRANHKTLDPNVDSLDFFAAGLSMVLHPKNPMAPTVHLNYRYFETANPDGTSQAWWFGGGSDLTPAYLFDEDAIHFHKTLKEACDSHDKAYYARFKTWCDEYFYNKHRGECRGVGGIFFDDLDESERDQENTFAFVQDCLKSFIPSYVPILEKRKSMPFTEQEKDWQQIRRGKYVEFNLVHDRGTAFGLNTPGSRVESILMSLPLTASWRYMHEPEPKSREQRLVDVLRKPKEWILLRSRQAASKLGGQERRAGSFATYSGGDSHGWSRDESAMTPSSTSGNDLSMTPRPLSQRELLTSLLASLAQSPPTLPPGDPAAVLDGDIDGEHDCWEAAGSRRHLLLTLHVLFPASVLPALDLLDRRLVTRINMPAHHPGMFPQRLGIARAHDSSGAAARRPGRQSSPPSRGYPSVAQVYEVRSLASTPVRRRAGPDPAPSSSRSDLVHLDVWSCSCSSFALEAFRYLAEETTKDSTVFSSPQSSCPLPSPPRQPGSMHRACHREGQSPSPAKITGWLPGDGEDVPCCKHLLACLLSEIWGGLPETRVAARAATKEELAGIAANV